MDFVDDSFTTHNNYMRDHDGLAITFGIGVFMSESRTQIINTKSSIECEIFGAGDFLSRVARIHLFLDIRGYPLTNNLFFQDN